MLIVRNGTFFLHFIWNTMGMIQEVLMYTKK